MNIYDLWLDDTEENNTHKTNKQNMIWYDKELKTSANMDYKLCKYMMKINGYEEICNRLWVSLRPNHVMYDVLLFTELFSDFLMNCMYILMKLDLVLRQEAISTQQA